MNAQRKTMVKLGMVVVGIVAFVLVIACLIVVSTAHANVGCDNGNVCWWDGRYFSAKKTVRTCHNAVWIQRGRYNRSAKNRCGDRLMHIGRTNTFGDVTWIRCLNPDTARPNPGWFDTVAVGVAGSRC